MDNQQELIKTKQMLGSSRQDSLEIKVRRAWKFSGLGIESVPGVIVSIGR